MNQAGRAARAQEGMEWGMMKRWLCLLLTLCLLPVCAVAEEQDFLTVTVGHVLVPMTALPVCLKESNLDGVWTDSCQLYGNCARDGNEFCVRTATITGLISQLGEQYPWGSGKENRMNAAVNYAAFYVVAAYGGKVTVEHAWADEATGNQRIVISYTYPDDTTSYHGVVCLEGDVVTALLTADCEHHEEALSAMGFVGEDVLAAQDCLETVDFHGMEATFTRPYMRMDQDGHENIAAFLPGYTCVLIDSVSTQRQYDTSSLTAENTAETMMTYVVPMVDGDAVYDCTWEQLTDGTILMTCATYCSTCLDKEHAKDFGQKFLLRMYATPKRVWYVVAADTVEGRAWLDGLRLVQ